MQLGKLLISFMACAVLFSCNTTRIISSWKAENTVTKPYHNIMVWGILPEKDSSTRKLIEMHLVKDLIQKGYHAVSSLDVYKAKAYRKLNSKDIVDEFKSTGVDAVITLVLLNKEKEEKYYPPGVYNRTIHENGNLDKYYSNIYERVFTPGYYITSTNYYWEANLFEVANDKMIYSVQTKSFDPLSTEMLAHENGLLIMKDMLKKKIIVDQLATKE